MNRRQRCVPRSVRFPIVVFGSTLGSVAAGAPTDEACTVELVGPEQGRWASATADLIEAMRLGGWARSCRSLNIDAAERRAELTFTALDGRVARRQLLDPVELLPTAQALSADGTVASPPDPPAPEPVSAPAPALVVEDSTPAASRANGEPSLSRPVFGGQGCVRIGANSLASPCVQLQALLPAGAFELGILGRYELRYANLSEPSAAPDASSLGWGVVAGRRERLGKVALIAGLVGLLTGLRDGAGDDGSDEAEARLGAYAGVAWPAQGRMALRADGMFEWVPFANGESRRNADGAYSMPWWAVTSLVGVELR